MKTVITTLTDAQWPADHPLRKAAEVIGEDELAAIPSHQKWLICGIVGEPRNPPPPNDWDVETTCAAPVSDDSAEVCGTPIVHRASAPETVVKVCWRCWKRMGGKL